MRYIVYGLVDPRTNLVRYVGRSSSGLRRPKIHLCPSNLRGQSHKERWLREVIAQGLRPGIRILRECESFHEAETSEVEEIRRLRAEGVKLTNATEGGKGKPLGQTPTAEVRRKIAAKLTGRKYGSRAAIRGENHPFRRLDEQDVLFIRERRQAGATQQLLADFFGVSQTAIFRICSGAAWRHVGGPIGKYIHNIKTPKTVRVP